MHKIVFLDSYTLNPGDLDLSNLTSLGSCDIYPSTSPDLILDRCHGANIVITNKCVLDSSIIQTLPNLQYIQVAATGYNNVDLEAAKARNIPVSNVSGYSTTSVAQQTFALLLGYLNQTEKYSSETQSGKWSSQPHFSYWHQPIQELSGKTLGIIGLGTIGRKVAEIGSAFGMNIISPSRGEEKDVIPSVQYLPWNAFLSAADVLTLHCPLTDGTKHLINTDALGKMKTSCILINTSRGGTVNEADLKKALDNQEIQAALLDVLSQEPPPEDHILLHTANCYITPHQAWGSLQARQRLLSGIVSNIKGFKEGALCNVVNA